MAATSMGGTIAGRVGQQVDGSAHAGSSVRSPVRGNETINSLLSYSDRLVNRQMRRHRVRAAGSNTSTCAWTMRMHITMP